jgi:hypothetical protein
MSLVVFWTCVITKELSVLAIDFKLVSLLTKKDRK